MSIRLKLMVMFLAIGSIPLILVNMLTYMNYNHSLENNRRAQLKDLTAYRADRINAYFSELKAEIEIAQGFYIIKKNLSTLNRLAHRSNDPEFSVSAKILERQFRQMQSVAGMSDIMLINPEGRIVYSNRSGRFLENLTQGTEAERSALEQGKKRTCFSDIYFDALDNNRFEMLVTAPATDFSGAYIGVIAFEVDMAFLYGLLQDVTGLGNTGEVLVGEKTGDSVVFLNPLRHDPAAALKRKIILGSASGFPMQQAVEGKTGDGLSVDYRGKQVIAAWRHLSFVNWGLVAKIDSKEAFADSIMLRNLLIILLVIVIAVSSLIGFSFAHTISEPIKRLAENAEKIGKGNWNLNLGTSLKDEVGQLSRSFDKMTQDLKTTTASRDELDREISERKKADALLRKTAEELARSNQDLEQFAYVASHDLQEPLRAVAGFVELLKRNLASFLDEKTTRYINFSVDGAKRMQSLINGLLDYSRINSQGNKPQMTDSKIAIDEAQMRLQASILEADAKIYADGLPKIYCDGVQLTQLFQNLIGNALKYRGTSVPQIRIGATRLEKGWQFEVSDNGIGIDPQYAERIFLIFQRLHGREKYPGTGIGLSICKRIVERHNGKIWVESSPGNGSTFFFTMPDQGEYAS